MNVVVCDAIRARRLLRFVYDGYERIVEPHLYGINTAGHEALSAYLVRGWSESEAAPGWRTYLISEMQGAAALAEGFAGEREGFNPDDSRMVRIYCRLEEMAEG
ncbi:MAG: hypothetical protein ACJ79S_13020 [Gemmatimonadaceae bacterium]